MKKILPTLVLIGFLAVLAMPMIGLAAAPEVPTSCTMTRDVGIPECPSPGNECVFERNSICGLCCVLQSVYKVTDWIFVILIAVVALMVIYGGLTIVTAGGAPEKVTSGRNYIIYAMIGLVIALLSKAIPAIVRALIGM